MYIKNQSVLLPIVYSSFRILLFAIWSTLIVIGFRYFDYKFLSIPFLPVSLIGTALSFYLGFKTNASYDQIWEARKIWGAIVNFNRTWELMVKDYISNKHAEHKLSEAELHQIRLELMNRHFAWLAALRYQLREAKPWEGIYKEYNAEFKSKRFSVHEQESEMADTLRPYLSASELNI